MYTIILLIRVPEYGERAMIERIQVLRVRNTGYLIVVPFEEARLHGWVESREHFVVTYPVDIRSMCVRSRRGYGRASSGSLMAGTGCSRDVAASILGDFIEDLDVPLRELFMKRVSFVRSQGRVQCG